MISLLYEIYPSLEIRMLNVDFELGHTTATCHRIPLSHHRQNDLPKELGTPTISLETS